MSTKSEIEETEPPYLASSPENQQGGQQHGQRFNSEYHALLREINNIQDNLSHMSSLVNQEGAKQPVQQFNVDYHALLREIDKIRDSLSHMSSLVNQEGAKQLGQQFNIENHTVLREINSIQDKLSHMSSLVNQKAGGKQLVQQFIPFVSCNTNIHSMFNDFNARIMKIIKTLSESLLQQMSLTDQPTSEERQKLSELEKKILKDQVMKNLQVSFDYLQRPNLKYCLVFLSIFPENAVLRKRPLIYWWIGESLISTEKEGEEIFEELLKLELIIPYGNGKNPFVSKCRIHPWIRYLLIFLAEDARLLNFKSKEVPRFDIINSRRACLVTDDENFPQTEPPNLGANNSNVSEPDSKTIHSAKDDEKLPINPPNRSTNISRKCETINYLRNLCFGTDDEILPTISHNRSTNSLHKSESTNHLRTIFNVNQSYVSFKSEFLRKQEKLAVLMLGRWQDLSTHHIEVENEQWLKELRTQKHLKYLSLRGISRITALPNSILEFTCLEILDLKACHNLETLPRDISPLKMLTHLDVSECYLLESMPNGLDKLTSLQVLKGFVIGNSKKTPCRIDGLRKLEKLKRLSIHIGSEAVIQSGEFQKLKDLKSVTHLKISWGTQTVKESFSFPPKLDKLDFEGFPHNKLPDWFRPSDLKELKKLYIKGGKLESLEHQREVTWQVEILRLHHLKNLKIDFENLQTLFPFLRYAQVFDKNGNKEKIYS